MDKKIITTGISLNWSSMVDRDKLEIGMEVFFLHKKKVFTGKILKLNPTRARVKIRGKIVYDVNYKALLLGNPLVDGFEKDPILRETSNICTAMQLTSLLNELKADYGAVYKSVFSRDEMQKLSSLEACFGKRETYCRAGKYLPARNEIVITASLINAPGHVIKKVLHHEIFHIHFPHHGQMFRKLERSYKKFDEAERYIHALFQTIRFDNIFRNLRICTI
ncbi:DUF45 domain-containing protein [Candidatus Bathyarchaeota archaeon]|nr:DUF45 domain-containing protein [Candidatus Bathyarchaeota archaeon]